MMPYIIYVHGDMYVDGRALAVVRPLACILSRLRLQPLSAAGTTLLII